jgi:L-2-hydroxyglutarate oxidase
MTSSDLIVIGGGIVGLATAWRFHQRYPGRSITLLEKEAAVAEHQTGRNSGVLHSGIYYKPGSLKAINCRTGKIAMEEFCREHGVPYDVCGKVIVAVDEKERPALERIHQRGIENGIDCEPIDVPRLKELEPHVAGIAALHVRSTGIVNYRKVCEKIAELLTASGHKIVLQGEARAIRRDGDRTRVETAKQEFSGKLLVNCAGLQADRVAQLAGVDPGCRVVPFRGEYFELKPSAQHLCRNLIYPVPDPAFPFLGVHFTRMIDGGVECGPNAVLAFAREGYTFGTFKLRDLADSLAYPGFLRLAAKHWKMGAREMWRSLSKSAFVTALQRLMPEIKGDDLLPAQAGVRAQAVAPDGQLVDDFLIRAASGMIHVLNAPSPAATSALNIGNLVVDELAKQMS